MRHVHTADRHDRLPEHSNPLSLTSGKSAQIRDICRIARHKLGAPNRQPLHCCSAVAVAVLAGWVVEAAVKWAVGRVLSHFQ
jgi:hypothetical protein